MRYPDEEEFYRECVDILIQRYPHDFGTQGDLWEVDLEFQKSGITTLFYWAIRIQL